MLLRTVPLIFRKRAGRARRPATPTPVPPPAALTLVSATYNESGGPGGEALITLVFDRAIDIAGFQGAAVTVKDGVVNGWEYQGTGPVSLIAPTTIEITLEQTVLYSVEEQTLSATAASGIVAVDDGGTWPGVSNVELPFP